VHFADGSELEATTVVWAAGVRAAELSQELDAPLGPGGRVRVRPELNVPEHDEVFVVGDMAYLEGYGDGAYPMVAQVAMQQGRRAAKNIAARVAGAPLRAFRYRDKGQMAMIGQRSAIVDGFGVRLRGGPGWLAWLGLHVLYLRGLRNRIVVVLDWIAVFVSPTRGTGIITRQR
jgi:NADH dehydrogenase